MYENQGIFTPLEKMNCRNLRPPAFITSLGFLKFCQLVSKPILSIRQATLLSRRTRFSPFIKRHKRKTHYSAEIPIKMRRSHSEQVNSFYALYEIRKNDFQEHYPDAF
jgi:hypothetical protein